MLGNVTCYLQVSYITRPYLQAAHIPHRAHILAWMQGGGGAREKVSPKEPPRAISRPMRHPSHQPRNSEQAEWKGELSLSVRPGLAQYCFFREPPGSSWDLDWTGSHTGLMQS